MISSNRNSFLNKKKSASSKTIFFIQNFKHIDKRRLYGGFPRYDTAAATGEKYTWITSIYNSRNSAASRFTPPRETDTLSRELTNKLRFFVRQERDDVHSSRLPSVALSLFSFFQLCFEVTIKRSNKRCFV